MTSMTGILSEQFLAELIYARDDEPGITRRRAGRGFSYTAANGKRITDRSLLAWIRGLAVPPAWRMVWIAPDQRFHILATGRDERGRKQYRYHPAWQAEREASKFEQMLAFAAVLPSIRERIERDLRRPGLPRERVVAIVIRLLEATLVRIGNSEYARTNQTYGLTTLRAQHLAVEGAQLRFSFKGKSGKHHDITLHDRRMSRLIRKLQELPAQDLFRYVDDAGEAQTVTSADVNNYLRAITGQPFTAKNYRTWAATSLAAWSLRATVPAASETANRRQVNAVIRKIAQRAWPHHGDLPQELHPPGNFRRLRQWRFGDTPAGGRGGDGGQRPLASAHRPRGRPAPLPAKPTMR